MHYGKNKVTRMCMVRKLLLLEKGGLLPYLGDHSVTLNANWLILLRKPYFPYVWQLVLSETVKGGNR